ncbi:hypothetical protein TNCT_469051 [Trichonephila clavata]|uniref:Uncharacterized protein n=1 Tax=Trichonephila clavata TaxID=2740835 RepID=A0A8X6IDY1_TRICU|nr:hypothetical protein TNCT_469051 [Trichonephila clavata]
MKPHLEERAEIKTLPPDIRLFLSRYKIPQEERLEDEPPAKIRGRCFSRGRQKNRVTKMKCHVCNRSVCKEHANTVITCPECNNNGDITDEIECVDVIRYAS